MKGCTLIYSSTQFPPILRHLLYYIFPRAFIYPPQRSLPPDWTSPATFDNLVVWSQLHKEHFLTLEETNQMVRKWVKIFKDGHTKIHDEERSGRPFVITEDVVHKVDEKVK